RRLRRNRRLRAVRAVLQERHVGAAQDLGRTAAQQDLVRRQLIELRQPLDHGGVVHVRVAAGDGLRRRDRRARRRRRPVGVLVAVELDRAARGAGRVLRQRQRRQQLWQG